MMASNVFSRLFPPNGRSVYDHMRAEEEGLHSNIDEENLNAPIDDFLDNPAIFDDQSRIAHSLLEDDEDLDNQVPASLLIEGNEDEGEAVPLMHRAAGVPRASAHQAQSSTRQHQTHTQSHGVRLPQNQRNWEATQLQQRLHSDDNDFRPPPFSAKPLDAYQTAMWTWINASNLDVFMSDVYNYYRGYGIYCICLTRALYLLTVLFLAIFTTFLTQCVAYRKIPSSTKLSEILVDQCTTRISGLPNVVIWCATVWMLWKIFIDLKDLRRLWKMHNFFLHLLMIPDNDIQTISWQEVVKRIMDLRERHPLTDNGAAARKHWSAQSKERLDAHDIANRIMRRENYLIALINKDILNLSLPLPIVGNRHIFSRSIEWSISQSILDFMFNEHGQIHQIVLKEAYRKQLSTALRQRLRFAAVMSFLMLPLIVPYLVIQYFFTYFNEYQKNPSAISSRQYTPFAEWTFRQFNELPHFFEARMNYSYKYASTYIDQFPKAKTVAAARFVAFIAGAMGSVLFLATLFDSELFLTFEVTPGRTALFYLGIFGFIWATARGTIPEDTPIFQPEHAVEAVIEVIRYCPVEWKDKLHSDEVKQEFSAMYKMKILIFVNEILSMFLTPFILWFCLPDCSDRIVDFFREFTVHVDGLGYVCSFAVFDFKRGLRPNVERVGTGASDPLRDEYFATKHNKLGQSIMGFLDDYVYNQEGATGRYSMGQRQTTFHPPPHIPDLGSPVRRDSHQNSNNTRGTRFSTPHSRDTTNMANSSKPSRLISSVLLDPAHQPPISFAEPRRRNARSRPQTGTTQIAEEDDLEPTRILEGIEESVWDPSPTTESDRREEEGDDGVVHQGIVSLATQYLARDGKGPIVQI